MEKSHPQLKIIVLIITKLQKRIVKDLTNVYPRHIVYKEGYPQDIVYKNGRNVRETIKGLRLITGMNAREFGKAVGVSHQTIYNWENGTFKPSKLALKEVARVAKKIKKRLEKEDRP